LLLKRDKTNYCTNYYGFIGNNLKFKIHASEHWILENFEENNFIATILIRIGQNKRLVQLPELNIQEPVSVK